MRVITFVDLDDTLFSTRRKFPAHLTDAELEGVSVDTRGRPHGFRTSRQAALFEALARAGTLIPVTGRSVEAFARVALPFTSWKVLDHGATLLREDGHADQEHARLMAGRLGEQAGALRAVAAHIAEQARTSNPALRVRVHEVGGQPLYVVVKHPARETGALSGLARAVRAQYGSDPRWHVFANDSTLTLMQACVSKRDAVRGLKGRLDPAGMALTLGFGDTLSDVGFMAECDVALTPGRSQIMRVVEGLHHVHG